MTKRPNHSQKLDFILPKRTILSLRQPYLLKAGINPPSGIALYIYLRDNSMIAQSVTPQKLPLGDSGIIPRLPRSVFMCQGQVLMFNDVISSILMPGDLRGRVGAVRRQGNPNRGPASRVTEFGGFAIILLSLRYRLVLF